MARSQWRPSARRRIEVRPAQPVERVPQHWYAFVYDDEYGHHEQSMTGRLGGSFVVRGMLYVFESRALRDEFVQERVALGENARLTRASQLPHGWSSDHAMEMGLSDDEQHWLRTPAAAPHSAKADLLPRDQVW